jgi:hypothetical protein
MPDRDDRDEVLDALMLGASIRTVAKRFGMSQSEVRDILADETNRYADAAEIKRDWALASRRLLRMELAFHERAMEQMDPSSAVVALKCNERRATLAGGGSSQPSHLIALMQAAPAVDDTRTTTQKMLDAILALKASAAPAIAAPAERTEPEPEDMNEAAD